MSYLNCNLFDDLIGKQVECEFCGKIIYVNELIYNEILRKDLNYFICKECFDGEEEDV